MSASPGIRDSNPNRPELQRPEKWSNLWYKNKKALNQVLFALNLQSTTEPPDFPTPQPDKNLALNPPRIVSDRTSLLSDELLLQILSRLPVSQRNSNSLVSKRWLNLQGRLVRSLKVLDWNFLISGRLFLRFPNLTQVNLINCCVVSPHNSVILLTQKLLSLGIDSDISSKGFVPDRYMLMVDEIDSGLKELAGRYPNLRKLAIINVSEMGLLSVAEECPTLQELELHRCNDQVLRGIAALGNLQILKLIGNVDGFYSSLVSDIGLTILAQGCKRLVKLELIGCEGSYDGIRAVGQCCQMLEELILCDHRMEDGWLSALSYCKNLKTLRFLSCKRIDSDMEPDEHLDCCPAIECLHLERCQLRNKRNIRALFLICRAVRKLVFRNCWGLESDIFGLAAICRKAKFVSLEGCSLLTTEGLASVILSWKELETLEVISCNKIKGSEVTPPLLALFSDLKEFKWTSDNKSLLSTSLVGTSVGKRGGKFFKKAPDWKSLLDT